MAGGKWSLEGSQLSTTTDFGMGGAGMHMIGHAHTFNCRIVGNLWFYDGRQQENNDLHIEQVWERQQPQEADSVDGSTK